MISNVEQLVDNRLNSLKNDFDIIIDILKNSSPKDNKESIAQVENTIVAEPISSPNDIEIPFLKGEQKNVIIQNKAKTKIFDIQEIENTNQAGKVSTKNPIKFSKEFPILNPKGYVGEMVIIFSGTKLDMGFVEFVMTFDFSKCLNPFKFYSLNVLKQLYTAYTGNHDMDNADVIDILNKQAYYTGITSYRYYDEMPALSLKGIEILQHNVTEYFYENIEEKDPASTLKESSSKSEYEEEIAAPEKNSILEYLLYEVNTNRIIKNNMTISDIAAVYNKKYAKNIVARSINNALASKGVSPYKILGKRSWTRGKDLAYVIQLLRNKYGAVNKKDVKAKDAVAFSNATNSAKTLNASRQSS